MRYLLLLAVLTFVGAASAHAELVGASPAEDETLRSLPAEVTLTFSEAVEASFGIFKVYPLDAEVDMAADDAALRLNGLASQLVSEVLDVQGDEDARADAGVAPQGSSAEVALPLKVDLAPGAYVVMWRVISADSHPVEGFYSFVYSTDE